MHRALLAAIALLASVASAACTEGAAGLGDPPGAALLAGSGSSTLDGGTIDTSPPVDGDTIDSALPDGGTVDSGTVDSGVPTDSVVIDSVVIDGMPNDSGLPDGGLPDGMPNDSGLPDGGTPDGGTPDGGTPDGGTPDGGMMPQIDVLPPSINAGDVPVGTSVSHMFAVRNSGGATLTFSLSLPPLAPEWTTPGAPCVAPAECMVAPGGMVTVTVQFAPVTHGPSAGAISIASGAGPRSVMLAGNGVGSRIVVIDPSDHDIDFGTIPRNSTTNRTILVSAVGNLPVTLDVAGPGAPFSVAPAQLALAPGAPKEITVGCGSPTATGPVSAAVALSSPNAYALDASSIGVRCEVANTQVSVAPTAFDFMEIRKGSPAPSLSFTISNPGPLAANVTAVELSGAPPPLAMSLDGGGFPRALPVGGEITGRMVLATDVDVDLALTGPKLLISVDGEQLVYPVTGKVTTPAAYVTPEKLALGTACAGAALTATVSMINSGTARLTMEPPAVDPAFTLELQSPPSYPAPLLAGTAATLGLSPAALVPGKLSGKLIWAVDAPRSPFEVDVDLELIETGTAISPRSLEFSTVYVDEVSVRYTVTLQNCSPAPVMVTVDGVSSTRGGTAAWKIDPVQDARTLGPLDKLTISVAFAPRRHGRHVAQLRLGVGGEPRFVDLFGDGVDLDFERTSFYACGCRTPHVGSGWPIVLAVALVVLRRRPRPRARRA